MAGTGATAANAPNIVPEVWTDNPLTATFNPGTRAGNQIFLEKSKGPVDGERIGDTIADSKRLHDFIKTKINTFGPCCSHVPIEFNDAGVPTKYASIVDQYQSITVPLVIREAHRRFGTELAPDAAIPNSSPTSLWNVHAIDPANNENDRAIFYDRVNAAVVAQCLSNTLTPTALKNLDLKKHLFTFQDAEGNLKQDGPTMLLLLLLKADPSTNVGIENHRKAIENAKLQKHDNNVSELISHLQTNFNHIISNGGSYEQDTYRRHVITALLSGPNASFNDFIGRINEDVKSGTGYHAKITTDELFTAAERFYNNEVSEERWTAVDPKDARIMALATEIEKLKQSQKSVEKSAHAIGANGGNGGTGKELFYGVEKWRTEKKGDTLVKDGTTYTWCPHHKHPNGHYNGLYYKDHGPSTHDEWRKTRRYKKTDEKTAATTDANKKKLTIANELKTAFATNLCVSEEDIDKIIAKANGQEN
jgi:hypothetical protein